MSELTNDDIQAWQEGRKSLSDLAAIAGVSKQAISARMRRRGIVRTATAGAGGTSSALADPVAELMQSLEQAGSREEWLRRAASFIDSAVLNLVAQTHSAAIGQSPTLGAQQIKALIAALSAAVDVLERTGQLAEPDEADRVELHVRVMTADEERQVRAIAEAEAAAFDHRYNESPLDPTETPHSHADDPAATCTAHEAEPPSAAGKTASSDDALADPLRRLADRQGTGRLRLIALSIGCAAPRDRDQLIAALVERGDADPDARDAITGALRGAAL